MFKPPKSLVAIRYEHIVTAALRQMRRIRT